MITRPGSVNQRVGGNSMTASPMTGSTDFRWIALQVVKWWCAAALLATGFVLVLMAIDWIARIGWEFPRYTLPFAAALGVVVWLMRRITLSSLRSLEP